VVRRGRHQEIIAARVPTGSDEARH
jgi:hypothetical protein